MVSFQVAIYLSAEICDQRPRVKRQESGEDIVARAAKARYSRQQIRGVIVQRFFFSRASTIANLGAMKRNQWTRDAASNARCGGFFRMHHGTKMIKDVHGVHTLFVSQRTEKVLAIARHWGCRMRLGLSVGSEGEGVSLAMTFYFSSFGQRFLKTAETRCAP